MRRKRAVSSTRSRISAARHAGAFQRKADVPAYIHVRIKGKELEDEGDIARRGAVEGDVVAAEEDASRCRQLQPGDHAQRRRLAAAGWPEHDESSPSSTAKHRIAHGDELAEGFLFTLVCEFQPSLTPGT